MEVHWSRIKLEEDLNLVPWRALLQAAGWNPLTRHLPCTHAVVIESHCIGAASKLKKTSI